MSDLYDYISMSRCWGRLYHDLHRTPLEKGIDDFTGESLVRPPFEDKDVLVVTSNGPVVFRTRRFRQLCQDSKLKGQVERYQKVSWTKAENWSRRSQNVRCVSYISFSSERNDDMRLMKTRSDRMSLRRCSFLTGHWTWQTWQDRYLESSQRSKDSNLLRQFFSKKKCHVRDVDATKTIDQVHLGTYLTLHTLRHVAAGFDFSRYSCVELKVSTACLEPIVRSE